VTKDEEYFEIVARPLRLCASYKPKFGKGGDEGYTLNQFEALYGQDPFYNWMGLNSPLIYAAHKAAGGMTSVYRQIGIGCQWLINKLLQDQLGLTKEQAAWSYEIPKADGETKRKLTLDGRVTLDDIKDPAAKGRFRKWMTNAELELKLPEETRKALKGIVIEVRQGYKSMDSKRQNADIANATSAYAHLHIPVLLILSTQIDGALVQRYMNALWLLLRGTTRKFSTTTLPDSSRGIRRISRSN